MGYSTDFNGKLLFNKELTVKQLRKIESFMGEDCRDHPEWNAGDLTWIDLELSYYDDGVQWNGGEKTYDMIEKINLIVDIMRQDDPEFGFVGELDASGEMSDDLWKIVCVDGKATYRDVVVKEMGEMITCPHCLKEFPLED